MAQQLPGPAEEMYGLALVPDLMFASRMAALALRAGRELTIASTLSEFERYLAARRPGVTLVDLSARHVDVNAAIRSARDAGSALVIAFGPHKDLAARSAALEAGAHRWVTNQRLMATLADVFQNDRGESSSW